MVGIVILGTLSSNGRRAVGRVLPFAICHSSRFPPSSITKYNAVNATQVVSFGEVVKS